MPSPPSDCAWCAGTGFVDTGEGLYARCECLRQRIAGTRLARAEVPDRYQHMSLDSFDASVAPLAHRALDACRALVAEWPRPRGLLLRGRPGCGKTHLAVATLLAVLRQHAAARELFVSTPKLFSRLQATFQPEAAESEAKVMNELANVDLLVVDDLGARRVSEWSHDVISELVTRRYDEHRATILTTNYEARELSERVGTRLVSRLREMCVDVRIDAPDYRMRPLLSEAS